MATTANSGQSVDFTIPAGRSGVFTTTGEGLVRGKPGQIMQAYESRRVTPDRETVVGPFDRDVTVSVVGSSGVTTAISRRIAPAMVQEIDGSLEVGDVSGAGFTPIAAGGSGGGSGSTSTSSIAGGPFFDAATMAGGRTKSACIENVAFAVGETKTLIDTTGTPGPGVVTELFMIANAAYALRDYVIKVYVDGESTPSISHELHGFGTLYQQQFTGPLFNRRIRHSKYGQQAAQSSSMVVKYPIPYKTSIKITLTGVAGPATQFWSSVTYQDGLSVPWKAKASAQNYANKQTYTPTQQGNRTVKFLDLPAGAGNSGIIAHFMIGGANAGDQTWLENNIVVYQGTQPRDGSVAPQWNSTGLEDFFRGCFYFQEGIGSFGDMFVTVNDGTKGTFVIDLLGAMGGIRFDDGVLMAMERGLAAAPGTSATNVDLMWCVWYYVPNP